MPLSCQDGDPAGWHHTIARFTPRLNRGDAADAVGNTLSDAANAVGGAVSDAADAVGNALSDVF
jgi:hypothetical protein